MEIKIGKALTDGTIQYISVNNGDGAIPLLRNFYPTETRVDALIALGNLIHLGPSPYGRWLCGDDPVHCCAEIRDYKEPPVRYAARTADNFEVYRLLGDVGFLYERGGWVMVTATACVSLSEADPATLVKSDGMAGLDIYMLISGKLDKIYKQPQSWDSLRELAREKKGNFYVFRGERYVARIEYVPETKADDHE